MRSKKGGGVLITFGGWGYSMGMCQVIRRWTNTYQKKKKVIRRW